MNSRFLSIILFLVASVSQSVIEAGEGIIGTWRSVFPDNGVFMQIDFVDRGGLLEMHTWNSVNNGEMAAESIIVPTTIPVEEAERMEAGSNSITIDHEFRFKKVKWKISLTGKSLHVVESNDYTDNSGREKSEQNLFFVPGAYRGAFGENWTDDIPETGWLGVWKNRDPNTRGFGRIAILDLGPVVMSPWSIAGGKLSSFPIANMILPIDGEEARSGKGKAEVEASSDHGFAKHFYEISFHRDGLTVIVKVDYLDPNRRDQEFESEFVRGDWRD